MSLYQSSIKSGEGRRTVKFQDLTKEQMDELRKEIHEEQEDEDMFTELESDEKSLMNMVLTPS